MRSVLGRLVGSFLLMLPLSACYSWRTAGTRPSEVLTAEHPLSIRVTRTDGTRLLLQAPVMRNDSVVGFSQGQLPLILVEQDVTRVELRRFNGVKTAATLLGLAASIAGVIVVVIAASYPGT